MSQSQSLRACRQGDGQGRADVHCTPKDLVDLMATQLGGRIRHK